MPQFGGYDTIAGDDVEDDDLVLLWDTSESKVVACTVAEFIARVTA